MSDRRSSGRHIDGLDLGTAASPDGGDDVWAILEIMGHDRYAGIIREHTIGGQSFVRVDVPPCGEVPGFSKLFGHGAIFSITPVSEAIARRCVKQFGAVPLETFRLSTQPALPGICRDEDDDDPGF